MNVINSDYQKYTSIQNCETETENDSVFSVEKFKKQIMDKIRGYNDDSLSVSDQLAKCANKGIDFNPKYEMMRIAASETVTAVKGCISNLQSKIAKYKGTKEGEAVIAQIKRIIKKAKEKVSKLENESRIALAAERAMKRRKYMEASQHQSKLATKRIHRKKQEMEDVKNADKIADGTLDSTPDIHGLVSDYVEARTFEAEAAAMSSEAAGAEAAAMADTAAVDVCL